MVEAIEIKSTVGEFELPRGYFDEEGNIYKKVVLRELTGDEEDILASNKLSIYVKLNKILANCIMGFVKNDGGLLEIKDKGKLYNIVRGLSITDRLYLFLSLRNLSIGNNYEFKILCPICANEGSYSVNLSELEIKKPKELVRTYELDLPSGNKLRMKIMTGAEEEIIGQIKNTGEDLLSYVIFVRVLDLNGKPTSVDIIKKLPLRDRNYIRSMITEYEGSIDTIINIRCSHCMNEFNTNLDLGQPNFFFPLEIAKV